MADDLFSLWRAGVREVGAWTSPDALDLWLDRTEWWVTTLSRSTTGSATRTLVDLVDGLAGRLAGQPVELTIGDTPVSFRLESVRVALADASGKRPPGARRRGEIGWVAGSMRRVQRLLDEGADTAERLTGVRGARRIVDTFRVELDGDIDDADVTTLDLEANDIRVGDWAIARATARITDPRVDPTGEPSLVGSRLDLVASIDLVEAAVHLSDPDHWRLSVSDGRLFAERRRLPGRIEVRLTPAGSNLEISPAAWQMGKRSFRMRPDTITRLVAVPRPDPSFRIESVAVDADRITIHYSQPDFRHPLPLGQIRRAVIAGRGDR